MRRTALQTFFRGALVAAIPFSLGVAQATTPACDRVEIVTPSDDDGGPPSAGSDGGYGTAECSRLCGGYTSWCEPAATSAGPPGSIACHYNRCGSTCGRLTDGLALPADGASDGDVVGRWFETAAGLEAASVQAFDRLARELAALGAPPALVARAVASAGDEVRHARVVGTLAAEHGGRRPRPARASLPLRPLAAVALENAVEGCVRETYGALVASWQALTAEAPRVRRALRAIAADEQRHAELAWSVARWAEPRLDASARRRVRAARRRAVAVLAREIAVDPPAPLIRVAGLPPRAAAEKLFEEADRQLWRAG